MFTELERLLADRTLLLTLSALPGGTVMGTAAELDRDFPAQLTGYVQSILETDSTLNQIREAHKAAVKELEAENKKALDAKRKTNTSSKPAVKPDEKADAKDDGKKTAESKMPPPMVSLFDEAPEPIGAPADSKTAEQVTV